MLHPSKASEQRSGANECIIAKILSLRLNGQDMASSVPQCDCRCSPSRVLNFLRVADSGKSASNSNTNSAFDRRHVLQEWIIKLASDARDIERSLGRRRLIMNGLPKFKNYRVTRSGP